MITKYKSPAASSSSFSSGKKSGDDLVVFKSSKPNNFFRGRKPTNVGVLNDPLNIDVILKEDKEFLQREGKPVTGQSNFKKSQSVTVKPVATPAKTSYNNRPNNNYRGRTNNNSNFQATPRQVFNQQAGKDNLRVMVMGGLEEVGRNMTIFECNKEIIIID